MSLCWSGRCGTPTGLLPLSTSMENRGFSAVSPTFIPLSSLGSMFAHFPRFFGLTVTETGTVLR